MSFTFCQKLAVVQPSHGLKNNGQVVKNLRNNDKVVRQGRKAGMSGRG